MIKKQEGEIEMVKVKSLSEREFQDKNQKKIYQDKLDNLARSCGWAPEMFYMAELLLNEIRKSDDEANAHLRERAKLLGLM
jgi:hypothetical protein